MTASQNKATILNFADVDNKQRRNDCRCLEIRRIWIGYRLLSLSVCINFMDFKPFLVNTTNILL